VTRAAIKEARVKELKAEILNSQQLKEHFSENQARYPSSCLPCIV